MSVAGAVLAGGLGRRMAPEVKPSVLLAGRPLIEWPLEAVARACDPVAIVCKRHTILAELPDGVERWEEPDTPQHPLTGIVHALERAGGPVLVCAADMPFVDAAACQLLIEAFEASGRSVVARAGGRLQPVLGLYAPEALDALRDAAPDKPLTVTVGSLSPAIAELPAEVCVSVDTPSALAAAEAAISASRSGL